MSAAKSRKPFAYANREEDDEELPEHLDEEGSLPASSRNPHNDDLTSSRAGKTHRSAGGAR